MDSILIWSNLTWAVIFGLGGVIFRFWIKSTIQYSVKHEYDVLLEQIKSANSKLLEAEKRQYEIRMKSALIAELMAEWVSKPGDQKNLRKLTNEAFLWLPTDLATELSKRLSGSPDALDYRKFMNATRKYILGLDDTLEAYKFITFPLSNYEKRKQKEDEEDGSSV